MGQLTAAEVAHKMIEKLEVAGLDVLKGGGSLSIPKMRHRVVLFVGALAGIKVLPENS